MKWISIFVAFCFLACKNTASDTSEDTSPKYYANYYIRYLEDTRDLKAEAYVKTIDSLQGNSITLAQAIQFQNKPMKEIKVPGFGTRYQIMGKQDYTPPYIFQTTRLGKTITQEIGTEAMSYRVNAPVSISKGFSIEWEGKPLSKDERLTIIISTTKGENITLSRLGPSTKSGTRVLPMQLKKLQPGKGELFLVKKRQIDLPAATPGSMLLEYYAKTVEIEIVK